MGWLALILPLLIALPIIFLLIFLNVITISFGKLGLSPEAARVLLVGTLVGADLLNWANFKRLGAHMISIGGAGVFDGIFLAGVIAALMA